MKAAPHLVLVLAAWAAACVGAAQHPRDRPLRRQHAVDLILRAFDRHPLVALSDGAGHGQPQMRELFATLIRDPRFRQGVKNIVIEFGNARYQSVLDRYVSGELVSGDELRQVWEDTTQVSGVWSQPMYERMLEDVRSLNAALPPARRVRVLAGDPPIDWSTVVSPADEDMNDWRDAHFAHIVAGEVMKRREKALLFIGGAHISRRVIFPNSLIHLLDARFPGQTWVVSVVDIERADSLVGARLREWTAPAGASVRDTWLGELDVRRIGFALSRQGAVQDDIDAVVVLDTAETERQEAAHLDPAYRRELARRRALAEATLPFRGGKIRFEEDHVTLAAGADVALAAVLGELRRDSELKLLVKAYADGTESDPPGLSMHRARTVIEWLVERGIRADRLVAEGCGSVRPLTFGRTAAERAANRRAELVRRTATAACRPPW